MALTPTDDGEIVSCPREIADSKWMDFDEYLNHPNIHEMNRGFLRTYLHYLEKGIKIECNEHEHQWLRRKYMIYSFNPPLEEIVVIDKRINPPLQEEIVIIEKGNL